MSIFISRLTLTAQDIHTFAIKNLYSNHKLVYSLFEHTRITDVAKNLPAGFLWVEQGGTREHVTLLIISTRKPNTVYKDRVLTIQTKEIQDSFFGYSLYKFDIVINPVRRQFNTAKDGNLGKLVPIKDRAEILQWFVKKMNAQGMCIQEDSLEISASNSVTFHKEADQTKHVTLQQTRIQGLLSITDLAEFKKGFVAGYGKAKSFGCGLLQIAPIF